MSIVYLIILGRIAVWIIGGMHRLVSQHHRTFRQETEEFGKIIEERIIIREGPGRRMLRRSRSGDVKHRQSFESSGRRASSDYLYDSGDRAAVIQASSQTEVVHREECK